MAFGDRNSVIYTQELIDAVSPIAEAAMSSTIHIYKLSGTPTLNPATGRYESTKVTVYLGLCRIQPIRMTERAISPGDDSPAQNILVSIPINKNTEAIEENMHAQIIGAPLNPELLNYSLIAVDVVDSDHPFERSIMFTYNQGFANG